MFARHLKVSCEKGPVTVWRIIRAQPTSEEILRPGAEVINIEAGSLDLLANSLEGFLAEALHDFLRVGLA